MVTPGHLRRVRSSKALYANAFSDDSNTVLRRSEGSSIRALRQLCYAGAGSLLAREMPSFCIRK
jgi:hypothetical protein